MDQDFSAGRIRYLDELPINRELPHHKILRPPTSGGMTVLVLSSKWVLVPTHFIGRRTMPCIDGPCPGCVEGIEIRNKFYLYVRGKTLGETRVLEVSDFSAEAFENYFGAYKTMRGAIAVLSRQGKRKNGAHVVSFQRSQETEQTLGKEYDLDAWLRRLWRIEHPSHTDNQRTGAQRVVANRIEAMIHHTNGNGKVSKTSNGKGG